MNDTTLSRNRHPVDELADVRGQIKTLQEREVDLKARISVEMDGADSLGGDEYVAIQSLQERKGSLDEKKIAEHLGVKDLAPYRKPSSTFVMLRVERRVAEVA